ncbi:uncharacterized protein LOC133458498 isoform X2 [Cololabis saira]|uniref:uncharacterized protein LOC133458498 isoform X2 n=1 Tax=Cololabis saira TaxID=129043 RepID=UPI002AD47E06|nr:uncharacterized protein LOC133458498 isoform X2 [Cololabis saira]
MADPETLALDVEREFQKVLAQIGGRERIYLVSDARTSEEVDGDDVGVLHEFLRDMFHISIPASSREQEPRPSPQINGDAESEQPCRARIDNKPVTEKSVEVELKEKRRTQTHGAQKITAATRTNIYSTKRAIDVPVIVLLFRQSFFKQGPNELCLREILKDVKARTRRASIRRPALVGLIRTAAESADARRCAQLLEALLRSVFHKHGSETIWVDCFIPKTEDKITNIKKHLCKVVYASQTADNTRDNGSQALRPFQCWFRPQRREARGQTNNNPSHCREKGESGSAEEGIPLKTSILSAEAHVNDNPLE